jgi:hypothetical protein
MTAREIAAAAGMVALGVVGAALVLLGCTPSAAVPPVPDAWVITSTDAGPCDVADAITQARLVRDEAGKALVVPCPK